MTLLYVQRLDGEQFEITLSDSGPVRDVKEIICKHWFVPPQCQQLIMGSTILDDCDNIKDSGLEETDDVYVTMLISFDRIQLDLKQGRLQAQARASDTLCQLVTGKSYSRVLKSQAGAILVGLLQEIWEVDISVKCQALKALGTLVQEGSRDAVSALCLCIADADQKARLAAIKSLRFLHEDEHVYAVCALSSYLDHPQWQIRCAAVKGLDSFSKVGNKDVIAAVRPLLTDPDDSVCMVAVKAYNRLAQVGSARGSIAACNALNSPWAF